MGIDYKISTWFPPEYPKADYKYPVIYLMDEEVSLGMVALIMTSLIWDQFVPSCMIIAVGHNVSTLDEWAVARGPGFTPPEDPDIAPPKRAFDFLSFLKDELIPFAEATYPIDPADRCLGGYSWSGEFTLYTLLHQPDLFRRYFIGSAIWDSILPVYLAYEEQLANQRKSLPVHAFFSVGSLEDDQVHNLKQLMEAFRLRNYAGFCLDALVVEGAKHASAGAIAWTQGLRFLYQKAE
jgi:predicted alpha/beta superfamily hydrolase